MLTADEVQRLRKALGVTPDQIGKTDLRRRTHGAISTYVCGCRCDECREVNRLRNRRVRISRRIQEEVRRHG